MRDDDIINFHREYKYTYFITITTNYTYNETKPIYEKFRKYCYNHDENSHLYSVKEKTQKSKGIHYHILYFTNKKLDYSKIHKNMPNHTDINIQLVKKTVRDIKDVLKYMRKNKNKK